MIEIAAVVASALGVWLTMRRKLVSWPITLLACGLYAYVFFNAKLYSDMLLQGVYAAFCIYGWWHWLRGVQQEGYVRVERASWRAFMGGMIAGGISSIFLGYLMSRYTDASLPHMDAALTSFSLVAQWWSTRKYLANWTVWIAVDILYVGCFIYKRLYLTAGLYAFFVLLALLGLREWRKAWCEQTERDAAVLSPVAPSFAPGQF